MIYDCDNFTNTVFILLCHMRQRRISICVFLCSLENKVILNLNLNLKHHFLLFLCCFYSINRNSILGRVGSRKYAPLLCQSVKYHRVLMLDLCGGVTRPWLRAYCTCEVLDRHYKKPRQRPHPNYALRKEISYETR